MAGRGQRKKRLVVVWRETAGAGCQGLTTVEVGVGPTVAGDWPALREPSSDIQRFHCHTHFKESSCD